MQCRGSGLHGHRQGRFQLVMQTEVCFLAVSEKITYYVNQELKRLYFYFSQGTSIYICFFLPDEKRRNCYPLVTKSVGNRMPG